MTVAILSAVVLASAPAYADVLDAHAERKAIEIWTAAEAKYWQDVTVWVNALEERRAEHARRATTRRSSSGGGGSCSNPVVPESTAKRESGCRYDAYNRTGCGGRGCIGFFQLDAGHFYAQSPWNSNVHGTCYGLGDPWNPDVQTACAARLSPSAWNL